MMRLPSLRAIQAFDAVARCGSFTMAADELSVTHGAVSRQVRLLEQQLDTDLFRRTAQGAEMTDDGQRLFLASSEAFAALRNGVADLKRRSEDRTITVSLPTSLALKWLVPRLPEFRAAQPDYAVLLDTNDALADFRSNTVDAALRFGKGAWKGLHVELLAREELVAVASPKLIGSRPTPLSASEISELPLLHDDYNPSWAQWFAQAGAEALGKDLAGDRYGDTGVLIAAAIDGQAVVLVRHLLAIDDLAAGRLIEISDVRLPIDQALYFVCRMGDQKRPAMRALRGWLHEQFAADRMRVSSQELH